MIFVGNDWAEDHHDIHVMNEAGKKLAARRLPEGACGVSAFHALVAEHAEEPEQVLVGIETDHGLWVAALVAAGYRVYAVNPKAVARYRERHHVGGSKSDAGDAKVLADLVRTDAHNHRVVAGDSSRSRPSRSWPAPSSRWCGPAPGRRTGSGPRFGTSIPRRWQRSRTCTTATPSRSWAGPPTPPPPRG